MLAKTWISNNAVHSGTFAVPGYLEIDPVTELRIFSKIAEGGGGIIYKGELMKPDLKHDKIIVIKEMKRPPGFSEDELIASFYQEVSIMRY